MLPRLQERGRRLLGRSRGRLPSRAEEGDGADTRGRAVSGCGREDDAVVVARIKLGWRGLLGRARHEGEASYAGGRTRPAGRNEEGRGKMNFAFFFFQIDSKSIFK